LGAAHLRKPETLLAAWLMPSHRFCQIGCRVSAKVQTPSVIDPPPWERTPLGMGLRHSIGFLKKLKSAR
jgi:hypothetical protein